MSALRRDQSSEDAVMSSHLEMEYVRITKPNPIRCNYVVLAVVKLLCWRICENNARCLFNKNNPAFQLDPLTTSALTSVPL